MNTNDINELLRLDRAIRGLLEGPQPMGPGSVTLLQTACARVVQLLGSYGMAGSFYELEGESLLFEARDLLAAINTSLAERAESTREQLRTITAYLQTPQDTSRDWFKPTAFQPKRAEEMGQAHWLDSTILPLPISEFLAAYGSEMADREGLEAWQVEHPNEDIWVWKNSYDLNLHDETVYCWDNREDRALERDEAQASLIGGT